MFVQTKAGDLQGSTTERYLHANEPSYPETAALAEEARCPAGRGVESAIVYGILMVVFVVVILVGGWWLLWRALNADQEPTAGGSFGDLILGDKNTRKKRRERKPERPE